ncbi:MAG TPA: penicillin-binding transpeptidase domain-containing protein, partial [Chthoniobacterales bacterium]|nr:penicillin-binding transpeptidase domain-containing protein [Chthoniobacterales bacterium]
ENPDNRYEGPITARQALARSKNGATVRLGMQAGVDAVLQLCKAGGIKSALREYPSTFLGSSEVTLAELALAYTIFPGGGTRPNTPFILERIEEKDGSVVWQSAQKRSRENVIKPEIAYEVHSCLVDALEKGTGSAARNSLGLKNFPAAGKTGTAYDFTEALFAGYDSAITVAVRAGFDKPQKIFRGAFGSLVALPVWVDVMNASIARYVPKELPKPPGVQTVEICAKSGLLATDKCGADAYRELATKEQIPNDPCSVHGDPRARIARDLPDAGVPRAALAVDTAQVKPVTVRGPTLLAENDPYNAVKSTYRPPKPPEPTPTEATPPAVAEVVKKAEPVDDEEEAVRRAVPVTPEDKLAQPEEEALPAEPVLRAQPVDPRAQPVAPRAQPVDPRAQPVDPPRAQPVEPPRRVIVPQRIPRAQPVRPEDEEEEETGD